MADPETLKLIMAGVVFILGLICFIAGLRVILANELRNGMQELVAQSARVSKRGVTEHSVAPILEATSRLIEAVSQLVRTAFGMGAFLCLLGMGLCLAAVWIIGWSV
ncbi:MAG: hypothetical protein ACYC5O_05410 [Anaerolineae bacterium]